MPPKPPIPKVDKALERSKARAQFREAIVKAGAESQVKVTRERGRVRRSVERTKTRERITERQESERARVSAYAEKSRIIQEQRQAASVQRVQTQADLNALQRREKIVTGTTRAITRTSAWETLVLIATLFFVMIFIYIIVTNGERFGKLTGSVGQFISGLSSNAPLFVAK